MGWRYQIPMLIDLGFRVVAPDMMGYGGTVSFSLPFSPLKDGSIQSSSNVFEHGSCAVIYTRVT